MFREKNTRQMTTAKCEQFCQIASDWTLCKKFAIVFPATGQTNTEW
jgi:hypothetical protein